MANKIRDCNESVRCVDVFRELHCNINHNSCIGHHNLVFTQQIITVRDDEITIVCINVCYNEPAQINLPVCCTSSVFSFVSCKFFFLCEFQLAIRCTRCIVLDNSVYFFSDDLLVSR